MCRTTRRAREEDKTSVRFSWTSAGRLFAETQQEQEQGEDRNDLEKVVALHEGDEDDEGITMTMMVTIGERGEVAVQYYDIPLLGLGPF